MSGFDVARIVLEEDLVLQTPIVALTANVIKKREEYLQNGMDDIIAKPIKKSRMIEVFNELFVRGDSQPVTLSHTKDDVVKIHKEAPNVLDAPLLNMLVETIGDEMVKTSLGVFREKIPEYVEEMKVALAAQDKDEVCSQAHKIKGAASSIGLSRVQSASNEIQQGDHPAWWENVHDWIEQLDMALEQDVPSLEQWLRENEIDD